MMGSLYHARCAKYLQTVIDHYDKVAENVLASCFDATCRAWKERFGLPYAYCGCPLPGDRISERFSRLKQRLTNPLHPTGDLVPLNREDALLATHASEHNTFPVPGTESTREKHLEKISKRQGRKENKDRRARSHDPAFPKSSCTAQHEAISRLQFDLHEVDWCSSGYNRCVVNGDTANICKA
ncbi:hypothetical protein EIP86_000528 [Pleurotus ostreatoroseus]|nr:hypothetical protein EIP86_000528 [Pleurotus ostreatoroseus]